MTIYPAIDMIGGKCVRLTQGRYDDVTVFGDDPVEVALSWQEKGAEFVHLVDLEGARGGYSPNFDAVSAIAKKLKIPVQIGGGIRNLDTVARYLNVGVNRVIVGTKAIEDRDFLKDAHDKYGDKIVVGIDAKDGIAATHGWEKLSEIGAVDFARQVCDMGVKTIIYTDIATDGMLKGPNISAMREMAQAVECDIIASGGVSSAKDIENLLDTGVKGVIVGKALYTGNLSLENAIKVGRSR